MIDRKKLREGIPYHRRYVGRFVEWDSIGDDFLSLLQILGLKPSHKLLDVGCGCLRSGRAYIKYLNRGNYYGMDRYKKLIDDGIKYEVEDVKDSHFTVSNNFDFSEFGDIKFDFIWLGSLVIHLASHDIKKCLESLRDYADENTELYMTIRLRDPRQYRINAKTSQPKSMFHYSIEEIGNLAPGWKIEYSKKLSNLYKKHIPYSIQTMIKLTKI